MGNSSAVGRPAPSWLAMFTAVPGEDEDGFTASEIAKVVGCSRQNILQVMHRFAVPSELHWNGRQMQTIFLCKDLRLLGEAFKRGILKEFQDEKRKEKQVLKKKNAPHI